MGAATGRPQADSASPGDATHTLEDVIDRVLWVRFANGCQLRVVRTIAWAGDDDLAFRLRAPPASGGGPGTWLTPDDGERTEPLPTARMYGVQSRSLEGTTLEVYDARGALVAAGRLTAPRLVNVMFAKN